MKYHKIVTKLLLGLVLFTSNLCTGTNVFLNNSFANTNPTREYTGHSAIYKGGFLFHKNHVPGFLGINANAIKVSSVCNHSLFFLFAWGDASINTAKKNAGIEKIAYVDFQQLGILSGFLYHKFCVTVVGE
jgi:hypothetical protein